MSEIYSPYTNEKATGSIAGFRNNPAWITLKEWITTEGVPAPGATPKMGDSYTILTKHEWVAGKGAIPVYCLPKKSNQTGEMAGDQGAKLPVYKLNITLAGDNAAVTELLHNIANKEVLIFVQKAEGDIVQYGSGAFPCHLDSGSPKVDTFGTGSASTDLVFEAFYKYFYDPGVEGLTEYPEN